MVIWRANITYRNTDARSVTKLCHGEHGMIGTLVFRLVTVSLYSVTDKSP